MDLEVAYQGEALDVGFNITYLLDVLQNMAMERVQLSFGDANPCYIPATNPARQPAMQ